MEHPLGFCKSIFFALALLVLLPPATNAQKKKKDNLGREFYVAFAENQGGQLFGPDEDLNFFALYITSKVATRGTVEVTALGFSKQFTTTPGTITTVELPDGKHNGDPTVEISTDEQIVAGMAVHITSDDDVAIYGISSKQYSTDAFMALPIDVLGTEYRTMNYTSSVRGDTPGEFWIVGVQDSTNVTIFPKDITANGTQPGSPIKVLIYKGDVFLVQGVNSDPMNDLTGSLIESDQPIAVLSGHVRTEIPFGFNNLNTQPPSTSRNHLVEQMPPVSAWGDSALVVRYKDALLPDLVRVISSEDNNVITANGVVVATLKAGDFYEITSLPGPTSIQGTSPIMVGQFLHTDQYSINPPPGKISRGDPAYALVFPVEQFDTAYTFIEAERDLFTHNYVNVVADGTGLAGMTLDGIAIPAASFQPIPGSNYVYAQIEVKQQGSHNIYGQKPFGITVYALGPADAYAYTGGTLLKTITPFKTVDLVIDFGDRIMTADPGPSYHVEKNFWDTTVYLQNISSDPYIINGFATRTGNDTNFGVVKPVTPPSYSIGPGVIDSIKIEFKTTEPGVRMHTKINAVTEHLRAYVVDVYGRGILPSAEIFSDSLALKYIDTLDFGILQATDNPKDSFVFVFNKGPVNLTIDADDISGDPKDFKIISRTIGKTQVTTPYPLPAHNTLSLPDTGAKMDIQFVPTGLANGFYQAQLDIFTKGQQRKVILIARIKTILKSGVTPAVFDTAFLCQEQMRSIFIDNPNDFPVTVTGVKLGGANAADFSLITGTPLVIPPGSRGEIKLKYAPSVTGPVAATAIVSFDQPKGFADTMTLTAFGNQFTSRFSARDNIHILPGEETVFPIYAKTPMEVFGSSSFILTISYDPSHLADFDYIQDNTLTATGSYTVLSDTAGYSQYIYQTLDGSVVSGGSDTEAKPLVYIKFKSHLNGEDPARFHSDIDINYNVEFTHAPVPSGCIASVAPSGTITLDSTCERVYLTQDTILYPQGSYIEPVRPNPVFNGRAKFVFDVPAEDVVHLDIIDMLGNKTATVLSESRKPGTYELEWDASLVNAGIYYVRLQTAGQTKLRKMIIAR